MVKSLKFVVGFLHNSLPDRGDSTPTEGIKMNKSFPMGALYLSGMLLLAFATLAKGATADAEVILVIGKAEVRETSSGEWKQVKVQQQLPPGASVRTGDASQMAVLLKDQTQIRGQPAKHDEIQGRRRAGPGNNG
jgi:hypothetical protein